MRRREFIASIPMITAAAHGQGSPAQRVRKLAPSVYCWLGDRATHRQTNVGWVVFRDYVLVLDANFPWASPTIISEIKKTTDKPIRFVFNTHYHADHSYGNIMFVRAGAAVVATDACAQEFDRYAMKDTRNQVKAAPTPHQFEWPLANASLRFRDSLVFDDGEQRVELIRKGPAHTSGDGVAYLPKQGIVFVGDLVANWTRGNNLSDVDVNYDGWLRVLQEMAGWKLKVVVPGHGDLGTTETIRTEHAFLNAVLTHVKDGIKQGKSIEQIVQETANDLTRYKPLGADPHRDAGAMRTVYRHYTSKH
ncbi:MAG TPA: MBL fold metallo-hydrolase [Terriglobia bacterium]|nr:MBL fold metallo-hydrolase [Terriglobia bacterium]